MSLRRSVLPALVIALLVPAAPARAAEVVSAPLDGPGVFRLFGGAEADAVGTTVAGLGDVDGDGQRDVAVGSLSVDGGADMGRRAVVVVALGPFGDGAAQLGTGRSFGIVAPARAAVTDLRVAAAGDVNGDGLADILVGSTNGSPRLRGAGAAYVVFGRANPSTVFLDSLGAGGFRIDAADATDETGRAVAGAGDVNGDGLDDVLVGAPRSAPGDRFEAGTAYLVYGRSATSPVALGALGIAGVAFDGAEPLDRAGSFVAGGGDVDGTSAPDVVIGSPGLDAAGRRDAGGAYVVHDVGGAARIDLGDIGARGSRLDGPPGGLRYGGVAVPGDVTGDGRADVAVGATDPGNGFVARDGLSVVAGGGLPATVDLAEPGRGFGVVASGQGLAPEGLGRALAPAGDVNGDGRADLLAGAPSGAHGQLTSGGSAYVIFGGAATTVDVRDLGDRGLRLDGPAALGAGSLLSLGGSVAGTGDLDGDGRGDLVLGAPGGSGQTCRDKAGSALVVLSGRLATARRDDGRPYSSSARFDGPDRVVGTSAGDVLSGMGGDDVLLGLAGGDCVTGDAGRDRIDGGDGDDIVGGGDGDDVESGGAGNDQLGTVNGPPMISNPEAGNDTFSGGPGNDEIWAGIGNDTVDGGAGNDRILLDAGADVAAGGDGNDTIDAGLGRDVVNGGAGDDTITTSGDRVRDRVRCGPGRDTVTADPLDRLSDCERVRIVGGSTR